jgi:hypothetical protein
VCGHLTLPIGSGEPCLSAVEWHNLTAAALRRILAAEVLNRRISATV